MQVDAVRIFLLHHFGGLYVDLDYQCLRNLDSLLEDKAIVLAPEPSINLQKPWLADYGWDKIVSNAIIACEPGHPFMMHVIGHLVEHHQETSPLDATGPLLMTKAWQSYEDKRSIELISETLINPVGDLEINKLTDKEMQAKCIDAYAVHHWHNSWCVAHEKKFSLRRIIKNCTSGSKEHIKSLIQNRRSSYLPEPVTQAGIDGSFEKDAKILILVPVKNAAQRIATFIENLSQLSYPHEQISLAFLEGDSEDTSYEILQSNLELLQEHFQSVELYKKEYGLQAVANRWATNVQMERRSTIAKCRNHLLSKALKDQDWVLWIDVDVIAWPKDIIEILLSHKKDILTPNCILPSGKSYDLNCWKKKQLDPDQEAIEYIVDGIYQPPTGYGRLYLHDMEDETLVKVDSVGGCMLLVKADLHREGLNFPCYPYQRLIETEALAAMATNMGYSTWGLPQVKVLHYEG